MVSRSAHSGRPTRRSLLTALAAGLATTGGCVSRVRTLASHRSSAPVSLSVKTLPVDEDPFAMAIAQRLADWFDTAGIDTSVHPTTAAELYRQTLVNHEFEVFVGRYPGRPLAPESLYSMLHSRYAVEPGQQNPFGYANLRVDEMLAEQRRATGTRRARLLARIQERLLEDAPFVVLGFPDDIRAVNPTRFVGWDAAFRSFPLGLLALDRRDPGAETLRATTPDPRPMANLNPLVASYRRGGDVTDLVFDPLVRSVGGTRFPWAAADWTWTGESPPTLHVTLREDLTWHDGVSLTAADVAFTYRLLADTSLGSVDRDVTPMRFRNRSSVVREALALDRRTVALRFVDCSRPVAMRSLTVPLLPSHVWRDRTRRATVSGIDVGMPTTEALVTDAVPAVGSGPFEFEAASNRASLSLSRFDDHFLDRSDAEDLPPGFAGGAPFETFRLQFVGSDASAVDLVAGGEADCTARGVGPDLVRRIGRAESLALAVDRSDAFYYVGFDTRQSPLSNPRFRRLLSRLLDRGSIETSVFEGYLEPAVSPLSGTEWLPEDLRWDGTDPVAPFLGSDGDLDEAAVEDAFRQAGYRYRDDGRVLRT